MTALTAATDVIAPTNMAASRGRRLIHNSSPSIARADHARSRAGLPKTNGLTASHTAIKTAWLHRRVHTGTSGSGVLAHRVQALQGLQCRANIARRTRATVSTRLSARLMRLGQRKWQRLADAAAGYQHDETVDAHTEPARGRHRVLHRLQE